MQIECASILCDNKFYIDERRNYKFPSKKYYCIPCRKGQHKIRLKCAACFNEFCPDQLTQKYCSGNCKALLHNRRAYQRGLFLGRTTVICKLCNIEIPPIHNTYRRKVCKPCRTAFLERYNKIKSEITGMQIPQKKKGRFQCTLCKKNVLNRLYCSDECSRIAYTIRKSGN